MSSLVELEINERNKWIYFQKYRWVAHVAYWIWVLLVGTIMRAKGPITPSLIFNHFFLTNLMFATFFYFYCLYLIPYYFKRNKFFLFWVMIVSGYLIVCAADIFFRRNFIHFTDPIPPATYTSTFSKHYVTNLNGYLINFLFFSIMLFFMEKNEENSTILELEKEKKEIEQVKLDLLKTKISPDFLLRSLHQLKEASKIPEETTPEAILTFSDLLRYRLYRGRQSQTTLTEELSAFESFIHFISLGASQHQLNIAFNTQGDPADKFLAPLALINLLEPFCKVINTQPVTMEIILLIEQEELLMEIDYHAQASAQLLHDLEEYGMNYGQLYGKTLKFNFDDCEGKACTVRLSLPLGDPVLS